MHFSAGFPTGSAAEGILVKDKNDGLWGEVTVAPHLLLSS